MAEKVKRYEVAAYSYKNQIRNLKRNQLHGGDVNIQLINVFINAICDIVQHICSEVRSPVLALLPLIHSILNSITVRDKKIYRCTKLIHAVLTQIGGTYVGEEAEAETKDELPPHKLEDLEWIAAETDDKGWLAISDRWELCKRDLKWLCVKTNNRSWLLYRHLWEHCSDDLKYVSVLFDDKEWLHLHNVWKFIPLSLKLRAISSKDPSVCKPSLTEMILKDDDIYRDNTLPHSSHLLSEGWKGEDWKGAGWKGLSTGRGVSRTLAAQSRHEDEGDHIAVSCAEREVNRVGSLGRSKYPSETHVKGISNEKEAQADVPKRGFTPKVTPKGAKQGGVHPVERYEEGLAKRQESKSIMRGKIFLPKVPTGGPPTGNEEKQSCYYKGTVMSAKEVPQRSGLSVEPHILKEGSKQTGVKGTDESNTLGETTLHSLKAGVARRPLPPPQKGKIVPKGKGPQLGAYAPILKHPFNGKGSEAEHGGSNSSFSAQIGSVKMSNGKLEGVTSKGKNAPKKMPPLTGALKGLLKMKEPNGKNISGLLKRESLSEGPLDLKKSGSIVHLDEVVIPTSSEDGGTEEEIHAGVSQRGENPKKAPKGSSGTYFSDLFNAFNFTRNGKLGRASSHSADAGREERSSDLGTPGEGRSSQQSGGGKTDGDADVDTDDNVGDNVDGNADDSANCGLHPMGRSLEEHSTKRDFLQVKKSVSIDGAAGDVGIQFQGDPLTKAIGHLGQSNTKGLLSPILEKPMQKFPPRKSGGTSGGMSGGTSGILQKVLEADLAHLNYSNTRMTADEIAKHKNASLHITVKRKASLSSLKMKTVPKR
ncbi:hypothetical protein PVMG_05189 [Plasmodium vivax Mauritania I]|uniref:Uncharacterized protein n=1 Tax=Plasmodium vivax Mauritania I TaxID=1035515 RepID=A0A0J9TKQ1_PLAVI|nr:hypothetical protein PVMG_05189 [Plasmodium vivax Mauritania I]